MTRTVERKIFFFRLVLEKQGNPANIKDVFQELQRLPCEYHGRMLKIDDSKDRHFIVDSPNYPIKAQLSNYKKHDWPTGANKDKRFPISLPDGSCICEATHFVIFGDGIVGMEYNSVAPRQGGLASFIQLKVPSLVDETDIRYLIDRDLNVSLIRAQEQGIRLMRLRIMRGSKDVVEALHDQLGKTLTALETVSPNSPDYEIIIRPSQKKNMDIPLLQRLIPWLQNDSTREAISTKKIKTFEIEYNADNSIEPLDLLQPYVMAKRKVIREDNDTKAIDSHSMYDAIIDARNDLKDTIARSMN